MPASTIMKHGFDGEITLSDGTPTTPVTLVAPYTVADLTVSGLSETQRDIAKYEFRGVLASVRHTARTYPSGSFSFGIADYSDATNQTVLDFLLGTGSYNANESTMPGEVYTVDITLTISSPDGAEADHTIVMTDCYCTLDASEGEPNTGSVSFEVLGTVTMT